jgi:uncharacterized protein (DUF433 family)
MPPGRSVSDSIELLEIDKYQSVLTYQAPLITKDPEICQGKPIICGTRISVSNIVELHYQLGWDLEKNQEAYPHLSSRQIESALDYYKSHEHEIDAYLIEEKEVHESDGRT